RAMALARFVGSFSEGHERARRKESHVGSTVGTAVVGVLRRLCRPTSQRLSSQLQPPATVVLLGQFCRTARTVGHSRTVCDDVSPRGYAGAVRTTSGQKRSADR